MDPPLFSPSFFFSLFYRVLNLAFFFFFTNFPISLSPPSEKRAGNLQMFFLARRVWIFPQIFFSL